MKPCLSLAPCLLLALCAGVSTAQTQEPGPPGGEYGVPQPAREGWILGLNLGFGRATMDKNQQFTANDDREPIPFAGEKGAAAILQVGHVLQPELVAELELGLWSRHADENLSTAGLDIVQATLGLAWYPAGRGFYASAGAGIGLALIDTWHRGDQVQSRDQGFAFLVGLGYEWRVARQFSVGPRFAYGFFGAEDLGVWVSQTSLTFGCHWYL